MSPRFSRRTLLGLSGGGIASLLGLSWWLSAGNDHGNQKVDLVVVNNDLVKHSFRVDVSQGGRDFTGETTLKSESSHVFDEALSFNERESVSKLNLTIGGTGTKASTFFSLESPDEPLIVIYESDGRIDVQQRHRQSE